jgi:hypothetical protein
MFLVSKYGKWREILVNIAHKAATCVEAVSVCHTSLVFNLEVKSA